MNNFDKNRKQAFEDLIDGDVELMELYEHGMLTEECFVEESTNEPYKEIPPERIY
ncbi:hypothetical protein HX823_21815 [Pseudomonas sp. P7759]|uniref:hypothetical protein n=1 Tax=Pseudomonas sp. P7759 TaxID=2738831 RepID=UPI0015A19423|nr:hypothetical protein [Pseudomonas sp. P7759]NWC76723.1 hypothetical protein [Pseudomonas sp. P7759]